MQSVFLEKVSMEIGFENYGEIMSPSDFEIIAWTHARLLYSFSGQIFFTIRCSEKEVYEAWLRKQ